MHPTLRCRAVRVNDKNFVYEEHPESKIPVHVEYNEAGDKNFILKNIFHKRFQRAQLEPGKDPHQIILINNPDHQDLLFCFEHFVCDGTSLSHLVNEFMALLSGASRISDFPEPEWPEPICSRIHKIQNPESTFLGRLSTFRKCASYQFRDARIVLPN